MLPPRRNFTSCIVREFERPHLSSPSGNCRWRRFACGLAVLSLGAGPWALQAQWQIANPSPGQSFTRLVVGGDDRVAGAVVEGFGLMVSPTGTTDWRSQTLPRFIDGSAKVQDLLWANGKWVTASPGYIHSSDDLLHWTASQLPTVPYVLRWDGSKYWAFGLQGRVANSVDAVNWTPLPDGNLSIAQPADSAWFNNLFVVVGQGAIASSTDGRGWTTQMSRPPYFVGDLQEGDGRLIAVGSDLSATTTNFYRSVNGTTWSPIPAPATAGGYYGITYGNGRFLTVNYNGAVYSSVDAGDSWQLTGVLSGGPPFYRCLGYRASDNRFFCGGLSGAIYSSTNNGATWVNHQEGFSGSVTMIAEGGGRFVGVGNAGGGPGSIYTSVDGSRWSSNNTGSAENFISLRYLNGAFLAYSVSPRRVVRSTDGVQFTGADPGTSIRDILWDGTRYVGYANNTNLYASADGVTWTQIVGARHPASFATTTGIGSFAFLDNRYLIFAQGYGGETRFFSSTDLVDWTTNILNNVPNSGFSDIIKSGSKYFVSAQQGLFSSADGITWTGVNYALLTAETPQPAGTSLLDRGGRLYTMQYLGANTYSGQRLIYSDDGATWNLDTNSFPAPFLPNEKNRLLYTGTRLVAVNFSGGLFAFYDIDLAAGSGTGETFAAWIAAQGVPDGQKGALEDPDGDGFNNGTEFALGTHPNSPLPADRPALTAGSAVDGGITYPAVTLVRRQNVTGVSIQTEGAVDAAFASPQPVSVLPPVDLGNGTERVTVRANTPAASTPAFYFRIRVTSP